MKRAVPLAITFLTAFFLVVSFFVPHEPFGRLEQPARVLHSIRLIQGYVMPQIAATMLPVTGVNVVTFNNLVLMLGVVTTILYFYFSKPQRGVLSLASKVGIAFIMISFGASFGYTLMARVSLLIGRLYFLLTDLFHIIR